LTLNDRIIRDALLELHGRGIHVLWGHWRTGDLGLMVMAGKALFRPRTRRLTGCHRAARPFRPPGQMTANLTLTAGYPGFTAERRWRDGEFPPRYLYQMAVPGPLDLQELANSRSQ
jgi:hypothetical protein